MYVYVRYTYTYTYTPTHIHTQHTHTHTHSLYNSHCNVQCVVSSNCFNSFFFGFFFEFLPPIIRAECPLCPAYSAVHNLSNTVTRCTLGASSERSQHASDCSLHSTIGSSSCFARAFITRWTISSHHQHAPSARTLAHCQLHQVADRSLRSLSAPSGR